MRALAASVAISERAGAVLREVMASGDLGIIDKGGQNNLQTIADKKAQLLIVSSLMKQLPSAKIIGEEDDDCDYSSDDAQSMVTGETSPEVLALACPEDLTSIKEEDLVIWVDPLDGTKEFTQGRKQDVTVLIGIAAYGNAVGGVIYQPWYSQKEGGENTGRVMWGAVGLGAHGFTRTEPPADRKVITTTRSHMQKSVQDAIDSCKPDSLIQIGGSGSKCVLVADGTADAYLFASPGTKKWDTCAGDAIIKALGGTMTDVHGGPIKYHADVEFPNKKGVLATIRNHEFYLSKIPSDIMERK